MSKIILKAIFLKKRTTARWNRWDLHRDGHQWANPDKPYTEPEPEKYEYRGLRFIWNALISLALIGAFVAGLTYGFIANDRAQCSEKAEQMGLEWDHGLRSGCQVYIEGVGWRPVDKVRVNYDGSES